MAVGTTWTLVKPSLTMSLSPLWRRSSHSVLQYLASYSLFAQVAVDYIGIRSGKGRDKKNFATQVLRVESSGPGLSDYSYIDLPGFFVNPDTVNEWEMHGINNMIAEYMKKPENLVM